MLEQNIGIDTAQAGMVLARDLCDDGGGVLLPGGSTLSLATLGKLRRRGVAQLPIAWIAPRPDLARLQAELQAERQRQGQRLERLFRHSAEQGATPQLLAHLRSYRNGA